MGIARGDEGEVITLGPMDGGDLNSFCGDVNVTELIEWGIGDRPSQFAPMSEDGFRPWDQYWERKFSVTVEDRGTFNAYSVSGPSAYFIIAIHGAGHSGLSFSLLARHLKGKIPVCALDLKCHGDTPGDESTDLSIDSLTADVVGFCRAAQPAGTHLILVGHSLGGSIAARVALEIHVTAVVIIDTIEVTSVESLPSMKTILTDRPQSFQSPADVVEFVATCGEMQNWESAMVSAGGRVKQKDGLLVWTADLLRSEKDWLGWFQGFALNFLKSQSYKVVVVPDINRLDKPFTIGHMQGNFQLDVFLDTNHCVHEDKPKDVAAMLDKLVKRLGACHQWD
jgi:protein phosphatase methylesterase 1